MNLEQIEVYNDQDRILQGWGTVEVVDRQGQVVPIDEIFKLMPVFVERGAPIMDMHTNKLVGKMLNYEKKIDPRSGKEGIFLTVKIFDHLITDDMVWDKIKKGEYTGFSMGGSAGLKLENYQVGGQVAELLKEIGLFEFSVVDRPANQLSTFTGINAIAKSDTEEIKKPFAGYDNFDACVMDNKDKENPQAYCAEIMRQVEGEKGFKSENDVDKVGENTMTEQELKKEDSQPEVASPEMPKEESIMETLVKRISALEEAVAKMSCASEEKKVVEEEKPVESEAPKEESSEEEKPQEDLQKMVQEEVKKALTEVKKSVTERADVGVIEAVDDLDPLRIAKGQSKVSLIDIEMMKHQKKVQAINKILA